jgi:hypothetical protein
VLYVPSFEVFEDKLNTNASLKLNCISINDQREIWVGTNKNYYVKKTNDPFVQYSLRDDGLSNEICNIRFFGRDAYIANKSLLQRWTVMSQNTSRSAPMISLSMERFIISEQAPPIRFRLPHSQKHRPRL